MQAATTELHIAVNANSHSDERNLTVFGLMTDPQSAEKQKILLLTAAAEAIYATASYLRYQEPAVCIIENISLT